MVTADVTHDTGCAHIKCRLTLHCPCPQPAQVDGPDPLSREAQRNATLLFLSHMRATFAAKRVLREYRLSPEAFTYILGMIEERFSTVRSARLIAWIGSSLPALPTAMMQTPPGRTVDG